MKKRVVLAVWLLSLLLLAARAGTASDERELKAEEPMTSAALERILKTMEPNIEGSSGRWVMLRDGVPVLIWGNESHNRIRAMAPVAEVERIDQQVLMRMMEANFATALDVRYAVFEGIVWAVFGHPLDSLRERDLVSGLQQVVSLAKTAGTTYLSSDLKFGPSYEEK